MDAASKLLDDVQRMGDGYELFNILNDDSGWTCKCILYSPIGCSFSKKFEAEEDTREMAICMAYIKLKKYKNNNME